MKLRGKKDAHWHLLIKITIKMCVFMLHPKASVNIATRDKPNHTLARYDIFYQHCFTKNIAKEIFECDQSINIECIKQHW